MSRRNRDRKNIGGRNLRAESREIGEREFQKGCRSVFDFIATSHPKIDKIFVAAQLAQSINSIARKILPQEACNEKAWHSRVEVACLAKSVLSQEEQSYAIIDWMIRVVIPAWAEFLNSNSRWVSFLNANGIKPILTDEIKNLPEIKSWSDLENSMNSINKSFLDIKIAGIEADLKNNHLYIILAREFTMKSVLLTNDQIASCALVVWNRIRKNAGTLERFCQIYCTILSIIHYAWYIDAAQTYPLSVCHNEASQMILDKLAPVTRRIYESAIELALKISESPKIPHPLN